MVRVEVMTPCACVGGAERTDKRVVVYNCTQRDCMLRVQIGPSLLDGLQKPYILLGAFGAWEVIEGFLARSAIVPHNKFRFITTGAQYIRSFGDRT